jgi:hypothetical protein
VYGLGASRAAAMLAGALIATTATGITYAATSGHGAKACESGKGVLALLDKHGKCPSGYTKTNIGAEGPRGPKGASGGPGPTASAFAKEIVQSPAASDPTQEVIATNDSGTNITVSGPMATSFDGRALVDAEVTLVPGESGAAGDCLVVQDDTTTAKTVTDPPVAGGYNIAVGDQQTIFAVSESGVVAGDSYVYSFVCTNSSGSVGSYSGDINVVATPN